TITNSQGAYSLTNVPVGEKIISVSKTGYITSSSQVSIIKNTNSTVNFQLVRDLTPPKGPGFKFVSSDGKIEKTIRLANNSDVLVADYKETVNGPLYIRFGLSPNLNDLLLNGKTNLEIVGGINDSKYGLRNKNDGQIYITFRGAQLNTNYNDGTSDNTLQPLIKTIEIIGNDQFSFNVTLNNGKETSDTIPPSAPIGLIAVAGIGQATLNWQPNTESDIAGYNVYRSLTSGSGYIKNNGALLTSPQFTSYALLSGKRYYFVVTAVDRAGNESLFSNEVNVLITQDPPPAPPTGLIATASDSSIRLDWSANGEADLAGYNIYRTLTSGTNYTKLNSSLITTNYYIDTGLTNGTRYYYVVTAVDVQPLESAYSSEVSAVPVSNIKVTFIVDMTGQTGFTSVQIAGNYLTPAWQPSANQLTSIGNNKWQKIIYLPTGLELEYKYLKDNGIWENFGVDANGNPINRKITITNQGNNEMLVNNTWNLIGDLPPATPTNFSVRALNQSVQITWTANTESDIKGYILERSLSQTSGFVQIGGLLVTSSYTDTGLTNGTRYYYRLKAIDLAEQSSGWTSVKSAVPSLNPAPEPPIGIIAYGKDGRIDLSWRANTESDIAGYNIYRALNPNDNFIKINSSLVTTTTYTDNGLINNQTYYYKLKAQNQGGNESDFSVVVSATPKYRQQSNKMYFAYHWHQHQPIYWPYENIVQTASNPKNTTPVLEVLTWPDRINSYTHLPIDFVAQKANFGHRGVQISYSGSLIENLNNLSAAGIGYGSDWMNTYKWGHQNLFTENGNPRIDLVLFGYHHPLMPFIEYQDLRLQIQMHKKMLLDTFGAPLSKGMFPPENAFNLDMIPALVDEGVQWVLVDNAHIDHCNIDFPWQAGEKINPANKADQINPAQSKYVLKTCETNTSNKVSGFGLRPHWAQWVNPNTGEIKRIIIVPTERSIGYNDSYGDRNPPSMMSDLWQLNDDPYHPILVVAAHDGDNAGASGNRYYLESCTAGSGDIELITIQDYLDMFPPDDNDVINVEQGCWIGADLGNSELHKWIGDPYYNGKVDFVNGISSDWNSWAVMTAARNR
ncbi:MAG TPA: hypothetical protein PLD27_12425, partial [bacterium]|nr:hypothetical protein [bacterium]